MFVICQVYLVNEPRGKASFLTKPVVKFGNLFFLVPAEIRCCRHSKNNCGAWNTRGSGVPENVYVNNNYLNFLNFMLIHHFHLLHFFCILVKKKRKKKPATYTATTNKDNFFNFKKKKRLASFVHW